MVRVFLILGLFVFSPVVGADDWNQWRGNQRDGVWRESDVLSEFSPDQVKPVWRQAIGTGYSSPTVADGRLFVMDYDESTKVESIRAFDAMAGDSLWSHSYPVEYLIGYAAGPRSAVTIDSDHVFGMGAMGQLSCLQAKTGKVVWTRDLNDDYGIARSKRMPIWGMACSPLVYEDLLIVQVGGSKGAGVVAFNKRTGDEVWKSLDDRGQYTSPVLARQCGQDVCICWTGDNVAGLDPKTGKVHWLFPLQPSRMPIGVASPVVKGNRVFLTSFYDGSTMLEMGKDSMDVRLVWQKIGENERSTEAIHSIISTPVWLGSHLYGMDSYGQLRCLKADTGKRVWEDRTLVKQNRWGTIHFVVNGEQVWMFNEQGELMLGTLKPDGVDVVSRVPVLEPNQMRQQNRRGTGVCWSHPAFANKSVYLRNDDELIRIDLSKK